VFGLPDRVARLPEAGAHSAAGQFIIMSSCVPSRAASALGLLLLLITVITASAQTVGVLREVWTGISGTSVADLTNNARFPSQPDQETILPHFEAPVNTLDTYGQRLQALITAPASGTYRFWIASDDSSLLSLSTDTNPINKRVIASVSGYTSSREWTKFTTQQSTDISLVAGQQYYIEALMKEGAGGDNLAVRWRLPNLTIEEPIPGSRLTVFGLGPPVITRQPTALSVVEGENTSFSLELARYFGARFQWQRNGADIPGATERQYVIAGAPLAWDGSVFRCYVTNCCGDVTSAPAVMTVTADKTQPTLSSVGWLGELTRLVVVFSEPVESASATQAANYSLSSGVAVVAAAFAGDDRTIVLTTTALVPGSTYTLTVSGVRDRAATPNTIPANTQRSFSTAFTPLSLNLLKGVAEPAGPSSRATSLSITEIMYHPASRTDERKLEFIELFNSESVAQDLGGFQVRGSVTFVFPLGTSIPARSYLVVAAVPADVQTVYGVYNVTGPFQGNFPNNSGVVELWNAQNALLLQVEYQDTPPWPTAADGAGHSLVLARPSYGEGDVRAWAASDVTGGSPGRGDGTSANPYRAVQINEFLAHTDLPDVDFVELYNFSGAAVDLTGCTLSDDPDTNKFIIPAATVISAQGFMHFTESQLGFAFSSAGETIYLRSPDGSRVIDAVRFEGQENGVSTGRAPDGAPGFVALAQATPGSSNAARKSRDIVISEIMFHPFSDDDLDEYVELHNQRAVPLVIGGWRFTEGIDFTFPSGMVMPAGGYLVVGKNANRLLARYPGLNAGSVVGDYSGSLANRGERIALSFPDEVISTNNNVAVTNTIWILADEVDYKDGGRWDRWADGGGSSLELRDVRAANDLPSNWAASDETGKGPWMIVEHTGVLDLGQGTSEELHVMLLGAGECLVDNVEVFAAGGANKVANGSFEAGLEGWVMQGNHVRSSQGNSGYASNHSLHLRATGGGDNGANRVKVKLSSGFSAGQVVTIRARARWLTGHPALLLRLKGNYLEAVGQLTPAASPGTPGMANSRREANAGPAICRVSHTPALPAANQSVQVVAQVHDPDGLGRLVVKYRVDPSTALASVPMVYNGAGFYSAWLPGLSAGGILAFHVEAADAHMASATSRFPDDAPVRECLIRFGEATPGGTLGVYRFWMTQSNLNAWTVREKLSNELIDGTFVYGSARVVYNAGAHYRGSPFVRPGYSTPVGNLCAYSLRLPEDERILGADEFNLDSLEPSRDPTRQRENLAFWIAEKLGIPFSHQRYIQLYVNGVKRGDVYADSFQPGSDYIRHWFSNDDRGEIFKIDDWFEFDDTVSMAFNVNATLQNFVTTGGVKKQARYRWSWERKSNRGLDDNYSSLFALVDVLNTTDTNAYTAAVHSLVDVEQWVRVFAVRRIAGDWDGYSYARGKNQFTYKPVNAGWQMLLWDMDMCLGGNSRAYDQGLFEEINDPVIRGFLSHAPFRRAYWRAMHDAVNGPLVATACGPVMDAYYQALINNGVNASAPTDIKTWVANRRTFILTQLATVSAPLEFTVNNGNNFNSSQNLVVLTGTAPVQVRNIRINGVSYPVTWVSVTQWRTEFALGSGVNTLMLDGLDSKGAPISGLADSIVITNTGLWDGPENNLVINEIMYNPVVPGAEFLEIRNLSASNAFDLTGYRLNGLDFAFPDGTLIRPGEFVLAVENLQVFNATYGLGLPVFGAYSGRLDNSGETLQLIQPGVAPVSDRVIDEVTFDDDPPWPVLADGSGPSLQLMDESRDNNRVAAWSAADGLLVGQSGTLVPISAPWRFYQSGDPGANWMQPGFVDNTWLSGAALFFVETSTLPEAKVTPLTLGQTTYYFRTTFNYSGAPALADLAARLIVDDGAIVYLNGIEVLRLGMVAGAVSATNFASRTVGNAAYEGPFSLANSALVQGVNVLAVEVHQANAGSSDVVFGMSLEVASQAPAPFTPGAPNSIRQFLGPLPPVWLNEVQALNVSGPADSFGERDPWVELHNSGTSAIPLSGFYLAQSYTNLVQWAFPANAVLNPGQFRLVWLDGQPSQSSAQEWHAGFRLTSPSGAVALTWIEGGRTSIVDYLNYTASADRSYGAFPDATPAKRTPFYTPSPGAANSNGFPAIQVFINEWMADNDRIADPADGDFDDWFELYNAGDEPVDLSGLTLTDNLGDPGKWTIPDGTVIGAKDFLVVWADEESLQNQTGSALHANFKLGLAGEAIGLFAPNGRVVDSVVFGPQTAGVSQGRYPDGAPDLEFMTTPTPGSPNRSPSWANRPPVLAELADLVVPEGTLLTFTTVATEPDAGQSLEFTLSAGAPEGAAINPDTGTFLWVPSEQQGPGVYFVTIQVADDGSPSLSDSQTFSITVQEVNRAPELLPLEDVGVIAGQTLTIQCRGSDPDLPAQPLSFFLESGPPGARLDTSTGVLIWRPAILDVGTTNLFLVRVADDPEGGLSDSGQFLVHVTAPAPPLLGPATIADGRFTLMVSGVSGPDYIIEWTPECAVPTIWQPLNTNLMAVPPFLWTDPVPIESRGGALYRIRLGP